MYGNKFLTAAAIGATMMLGAATGYAGPKTAVSHMSRKAQEQHWAAEISAQKAQRQRWATEGAARRRAAIAHNESVSAEHARLHAETLKRRDAQAKDWRSDTQEQNQSFAQAKAERRRREIAQAESVRAEHARLHAERIAHAHHK